nr:kinesin protein kif26a [Hymenolepis microstoma]
MYAQLRHFDIYLPLAASAIRQFPCNAMESPHIYHQVRPLSLPKSSQSNVTNNRTPTEHIPRISSRHRGSWKSDEEHSQFGSHLNGHRRTNGSSNGGSNHRSRSAHSPSSSQAGSRRSSGRPLSASYAHRPLPPPPQLPRYHFGCLLRNNLLPMPPGLVAKSNLSGSRFIASKVSPSAGDVKVILCVKMPTTTTNTQASSLIDGASSTPCVMIDPRRKQVTLVHPAPTRRRFGLTAPKMFSFDSVYTQDDPLAEVCSTALTDAVYSVVHGTDSCVLCFGHAKTSKSRTMLGSDTSVASLGVIPCAIAWLFRLVGEQKEVTKTRFSVRVSAVEVFGHEESFKDLLQDSAFESGDDHLQGPAPSSYLRDSSPNSKNRSMSNSTNPNDNTPAARLSQVLDKLSEIRAPTAGHAAHLLDVALANRAQNTPISHTLFTLHVYQYKVEKNGAGTEVSGGRSRLQLLYLGCGRYGSKEIGQAQDQSSTSKSLSLANIANVLLGLLTGQRQLPHRESAVTQLLREGMTGNHAQPCIIAHASGQQQHYSETLQVIQLASKLHRLRRRRVGSSGGSSTGGSNWNTSIGGTTSDSSTSSRGFRSRLSARPRLGRSSFGASTTDYTSSSEQSCAGDTVIYLGGASETESSLGPRGLADGSVVHSADEWKNYANSSEEGTLQRPFSAGKTRIGRSLSQSENGGTLRSSGLIKRVTPRTNATAWPRAAAVRKGKEVVSSTEETWVDGPNAMVMKGQQTASQTTCTEKSQSQPPPPAPPYFGVTHHIIPQNQVQATEIPKVFVALPVEQKNSTEIDSANTPTELHIKEPTYASIDEMKQSGQSSESSSCSTSESTSGSSDNENDQERTPMKSSGGNSTGGGVGGGGRGFAVLSDISERTEETEGGTSAPSSIAGGAHEERENTLLDLAIQQSNLMNANEQDGQGEKRTISWCLNDTFSEYPQISFLQSNYATPQLEHKSIKLQITTPKMNETATPVHQPRVKCIQSPGFVEKGVSTDPSVIEPKVTQLPTPSSDRSRHSPRRRKHSNTASSFDRVAAWVKDVSTDLEHVEADPTRPSPSRTPAQSQPESRSSSCHRSCCSRRHRSHRKRRTRRHHHSHHHRHHETTCSKCARDSCALCEAQAEKCCSKACHKCSYYDEHRGKHASESLNHGSSCSNPPKPEASSKSPTAPVIVQANQQHNGAQKALSTFPSPLVMQRTVSFPWMQPQMTRSSTVHSTPCQPQQAHQAYWPPMYAPQTPQVPVQQTNPMQYYPWSLPTSPYLQNSMQAWSAQLPVPSTAASDLSQAAPPQSHYAYPRRPSDSVDVGTPTHTTLSSASELPQDVKKSRFFTLPSILCTLRRWHARRKERKSKKAVEVTAAEKTPVIDDQRNMPMRSSASLPGAYSRNDFQRRPSSDQGIVGTTQYHQHYPATTTTINHHQMYPQMCAGDPSSFMNQMQQSLSTYRTSRSVGISHKDSRGDRGSSGYESYRQGMTTGSAGGGPGCSSEVSSAHTDSVDSCSSGCPQQQMQQCQYNLQKSQQGICCPSQPFYATNQQPMPYMPQSMTSPGHQSFPMAITSSNLIR